MVFGLFRSDTDTSQIDALLEEVNRLGRRMGGLASMDGDGRESVIRTFKLSLILDTAPGHKRLLLDAKSKILKGRLSPKSIQTEILAFRETYAEYHCYLDALNQQGSNEEPKLFLERPDVESYF